MYKIMKRFALFGFKGYVKSPCLLLGAFEFSLNWQNNIKSFNEKYKMPCMSEINTTQKLFSTLNLNYTNHSTGFTVQKLDGANVGL